VGLIASVLFGGCGESTDTPSTAAVPADSQLVDIGTHRLFAKWIGEGSPTVVIDVGMGETYESWQPIIDEFSGKTTVVIYDRAGYRQSDPGPHPRTAGQSAHELRSLLERMPVQPPYILVGHSLGGLHTMLLAYWDPEAVAGMVLMDPPPREFIAGRRFPNLREQADQITAEVEQAAAQSREQGLDDQAEFLEAVASEHDAMFRVSPEQIAIIDGFGNLPLIVLSSGIPNPEFGDSAQAFQEFWIESNRRLAELSQRGEFILAGECGHHIHRDDPGLVLGAIDQVLESVQR
jgi:pimeloyl-ACP methyl ester carboxylesterase